MGTARGEEGSGRWTLTVGLCEQLPNESPLPSTWGPAQRSAPTQGDPGGGVGVQTAGSLLHGGS